MKRMLVILILGVALLGACATPPVDQEEEPTYPTASLSEATMAAKVDEWSRPIEKTSVFTDDTSKIYCCVKLSDAPDNTEIKAEWIYIRGEEEDLSNYKIGEHSLTASGTQYLHFDQTQTVSGWLLGDYEVKLYLNGKEKVAVPFTIEAAPPEPEVKELLVLRMHGWVSGKAYWVSGTVKNVGTVPLQDVQFEVSFYAKDGSLITTVSAPLEPSTIDVWNTAHCEAKMQQVKELKTFRYEFILPSGEVIPVRFE